jgi:adenosylcobinamide kinase/adenosylcobinamide-phosphate guanylyltransferase
MTATVHHLARRTLVFGGARSGKSRHAEQIALASSHKEVIYIATARPADSDVEMEARIAEHRRQRPAKWITVEEPLGLGEAIQEWCAPERIVLVDCLTVWLSNIMFSSDASYPDVGRIVLPTLFHQLRSDFLRTIEHAAGDLVLVSNEVGMGIVPVGAVSRSFTDEAGRLNQDVAAVCDHVLFVAAGLPLTLKGHP